ncbi:hypothetical protein T05_11214 [Trichinella murrelli]|uniref:Uncharacterized protein n=1 Tax=Trichinella murrelli TaxID=144512 RepID=A0A0V0T280_9BILA|nr:hypothetical protein T05_11214 [Trichinella murrelli]
MTTKFYAKFATNQGVKRHVFDVYAGSTPLKFIEWKQWYLARK